MAIVRRLPPERRSQVLAFARFIAYETFKPQELAFLEEDEFPEEEFTENDERWEAMLASEAGQGLLDQLADEALAGIRQFDQKKDLPDVYRTNPSSPTILPITQSPSHLLTTGK